MKEFFCTAVDRIVGIVGNKHVYSINQLIIHVHRCEPQYLNSGLQLREKVSVDSLAAAITSEFFFSAV